jgi:5-methylcytosine-specific restriction endonuclease McrA
MAKKDLSYKYDTCKCGGRKLKRSLTCGSCQREERKGKRCCAGDAKQVVSGNGCCVVCATPLKPRQKAFCGLPCRLQHLRVPERQCVACGVTFKPKGSKPKYCTNECANRHKAELYRQPESKMQQNKTTVNGCRKGACCRLSYSPCESCKCKKPTLKKRRFCSTKCQSHYHYRLSCDRGATKRFKGMTVCQWCGSKRFNRVHANKMFCSCKCSSKHGKAQRRHRKKATVSEHGVNWKSAVKRFGWGCACCKTECVRPQGFNLPNEATLDHIHPIAKGGSHTWDNVQVLCRSCNTRKSDSETFMYDSAALTK